MLRVTDVHGEVYVIPNPSPEVRAKLVPGKTYGQPSKHRTHSGHDWTNVEARVVGKHVLLKLDPVGVFRILSDGHVHTVEEV